MGNSRGITNCEQDQSEPIVSNQFQIKYHLFVEKLSLNSLFLSASVYLALSI